MWSKGNAQRAFKYCILTAMKDKLPLSYRYTISVLKNDRPMYFLSVDHGRICQGHMLHITLSVFVNKYTIVYLRHLHVLDTDITFLVPIKNEGCVLLITLLSTILLVLVGPSIMIVLLPADCDRAPYPKMRSLRPILQYNRYPPEFHIWKLYSDVESGPSVLLPFALSFGFSNGSFF